MNLELSGVPANVVYKIAGGLAKFFDTAAEHSSGRTTSADILRLIVNGQYMLWVLFDKETKFMHGFFVTEVRDYPQVKMLVVQHVVIEDNLMVLVESKMQDLALKFAKESGCAGVEFVGRPGWRDYAKRHGYIQRAVIFEKMLEKVTP